MDTLIFQLEDDTRYHWIIQENHNEYVDTIAEGTADTQELAYQQLQEKLGELHQDSLNYCVEL